MKKFLCIILSFVFLFLLCGCDNKKTESVIWGQELTIIKMHSTPKCKTSNSISVVEDVLDVLGQIKKTPLESSDINDGGEFMIKLNVDGSKLTYTVGDIFTDANGKQYKVDNLDEIKEKLSEIYDKITAQEKDYT